MNLESAQIVMINPPSLCVEYVRLEVPLGLLYLASAAREREYNDIILYDMCGCTSEKEIAARIRNIPEAPIYALSALCTNHEYAKQVVRKIRIESPSAYIVMGGANPSALPELTLSETGVDVVVVGEGEDAFVSCIESCFLQQPVKGVVRGKPRNNIDTYPFPARDLVEADSYSRRLQGERVLSLLSSRGCIHRCAFCNSIVMGGGAAKVRYRSSDNVAREIESLRESCRYFRFNDDCFTANPRLKDLLARLSELDTTFRIFARIEDLTPEICRALRDSGCVHVAVGLESLNPDNLSIIGKAGQIGKERHVQAAKDAGLAVRAFFMVGLPYDTDETVEYYFSRVAELPLDEFSVYPMIPYPGTRIARHPQQFGYTIVNTDFRDYVQIGKGKRTCYALRHRNFEPEEVETWHHRVEQTLLDSGMRHSIDSDVAN